MCEETDLHYRIREKSRLFRGKIFDLTTNDVILPNGRKSRLDVIEHPGAAVMVALFDNEDVLLVRQFRFAAREYLYELPAGTLERGEAPASCARRELAEETGYAPSRLKKLSVIYSAPGFCTERLHLFLATGLKERRLRPDPDECISIKRIPLERAIAMTYDGRIRDAKSIAGLHLARRIV